ncbi:hypothetical protein PoB_003198000 [Plakobranchus ocellatus]|uniref:Uncharacterized protein n=1 Tax=Plakobranchus ocellatus TaxID=259542 RepID=A0AAV4AFE0_9GAST|nr:hypothetical protein PoB_003198000 [Plakobranchus ocellatus]
MWELIVVSQLKKARVAQRMLWCQDPFSLPRQEYDSSEQLMMHKVMKFRVESLRTRRKILSALNEYVLQLTFTSSPMRSMLKVSTR